MTDDIFSPQEITEELISARIGEEVAGYVKVKEEGLSKNRWSIHTEVVVRNGDGDFFRFYFQDPTSEMGSIDDWELTLPDGYEPVVPVEVNTIQYVKKV